MSPNETIFELEYRIRGYVLKIDKLEAEVAAARLMSGRVIL